MHRSQRGLSINTFWRMGSLVFETGTGEIRVQVVHMREQMMAVEGMFMTIF